MSPTWDAVVVGGGLLGSAAAYCLAGRGVRTLLVEQGDLASGASGANFGNIQVQDAEFGLSLELTRQGYAAFADLQHVETQATAFPLASVETQDLASLRAEPEADCEFRPGGSLLLIENERQWAMMEKRAARLQAAGVDARLLGRDDLLELEPALSPETTIGALYHPHEGQLNPFKLVHAYARRGREHGLTVWTHTEVTRVCHQAGRVTGVMTGAGPVAADWVVLAAGAWARRLAQTAGVDLPLRWVHGEALITEPLPPLTGCALSSAAFFEATEESDEQVVGFCLRQRPRGAGNVMIGEAASLTQALGRSVTAPALPAIAREARRHLPALRRAAVVRAWAIPVAFVPDNRPLLGPVDGLDGLLVATGLKSTIVLTPLVGRLVADMVTGRPVDPRLAEFSPSRSV